MRQALQTLLGALQPGVHEHVLEGFELLLIKAQWGELALARQGAQVLHYRPDGEAPLLWLSDRLKAPPAAIRGGVPLCWPWFGGHPSQPELPAHGVARTAIWSWTLDDERADGVALHAVPPGELWPGLECELTVAVRNRALEIVLNTRNVGREPQEFTQALHSYLAVADVDRIDIRGLRGRDYLDKLQAGAIGHQDQELRLVGALDRIYRHKGVTEVRDPVLQRCLQVTKDGSGSTVVWNPGEAAATLADVGAEQRCGFVCVEAANTSLDPVRLLPGAACSLGTTLSTAGLG